MISSHRRKTSADVAGKPEENYQRADYWKAALVVFLVLVLRLRSQWFLLKPDLVTFDLRALGVSWKVDILVPDLVSFDL